MSDPVIRVAHTVAQYPDGEIIVRLLPGAPAWLEFMDWLYPTLIQNSEERGSGALFGGFKSSGEFIGTLCSRRIGHRDTVAAYRKNPWLVDDQQWMLRFFLAASHRAGSGMHYGYCKLHNYGTMRLWQKLGLGAKLIQAGKKAQSDGWSADSDALLRRLLVAAKPVYMDLRASAVARLASVGDKAKAMLPRPFEGEELGRYRVTVA